MDGWTGGRKKGERGKGGKGGIIKPLHHTNPYLEGNLFCCMQPPLGPRSDFFSCVARPGGQAHHFTTPPPLHHRLILAGLCTLRASSLGMVAFRACSCASELG